MMHQNSGVASSIDARPTHPENPLVDFVVCGTQKGGTSALHSYLREHPKVCMPEQKELHFFDSERHFRESRIDYTFYHALFPKTENNKLIGEASPSYMYWYDAPRRLWEYNPKMKLIVLLRNPITRAFSHWNMESQRKAEHLPFWDAIKNERSRCREALPHQHRVFSYIDRGFYLEQLRRLWTFFPEEQVLILPSDALRDSPRSTLRTVCDFLLIDRLDHVESRFVHSRSYAAFMSSRERDYLRSIFEYEIQGIERVLNWDCGNWR